MGSGGSGSAGGSSGGGWGGTMNNSYSGGNLGGLGTAGVMSGGAGGSGMLGYGGGGRAGVANSGWGGPMGSAGPNYGYSGGIGPPAGTRMMGSNLSYPSGYVKMDDRPRTVSAPRPSTPAPAPARPIGGTTSPGMPGGMSPGGYAVNSGGFQSPSRPTSVGGGSIGYGGNLGSLGPGAGGTFSGNRATGGGLNPGGPVGRF